MGITSASCVVRNINLSSLSLVDHCSSLSRSCRFKSLVNLKRDHTLQTIKASHRYEGTHTQISFLRDSSFRNYSVCKTHSSIRRTYLGRAAKAESHVTDENVGVLLLNLGGPETLQDVEPFLFNLFSDPDIIRLPTWIRFFQIPLAKLISVTRASKSKEGYASIGGGSPLRRITDDQANALKRALEAKKQPVNVYVGMRYWHPFTEDAVNKIKEDGIKTLVVLPLYPQFSISTTGSSIRVLKRLFKADAHLRSLRISIIESWYQRQGYIMSMADLIMIELEKFSNSGEVMIFFSAHGVPLSYVKDAGDPYKDQMEECVKLIMKEMQGRGFHNDHTLAYQSRVGPVEWLKPYTDEVLVDLGKKGVKSLVAVPISFVSEHIETLEEIDMQYKKLALKSGIENWGRVPALGCTPSFIEDLADTVLEALPLARNPRCAFCIGPNPCFP